MDDIPYSCITKLNNFNAESYKLGKLNAEYFAIINMFRYTTLCGR